MFVEFIYISKRKEKKNKIEIEERGRKKGKTENVRRREGKRIPYIVFRISLLEFRAPQYQIDIHFRLTIAYIYIYICICKRVAWKSVIYGANVHPRNVLSRTYPREKRQTAKCSRAVEFSACVCYAPILRFIFFFSFLFFLPLKRIFREFKFWEIFLDTYTERKREGFTERGLKLIQKTRKFVNENVVFWETKRVLKSWRSWRNIEHFFSFFFF